MTADPVASPDHGLDLEAVRQQQPDAMGAFYDAFFERVYALAYRLTGERTRAEDLTQEVFLRVHRFASTLDVTRPPWPWLAQITNNAFQDRVRRGAHRLRTRSVSIDESTRLAGRLEHGGDAPEQQVEQKEREALVQRELDALPDEQRTIVLLRDWEGMSHREIADTVGVSEVASRKAYSRAVASLRSALKRVLT